MKVFSKRHGRKWMQTMSERGQAIAGCLLLILLALMTLFFLLLLSEGVWGWEGGWLQVVVC